MEERSFRYKYPHPALTSDCVVVAKEGKESFVLLIERKNEPYKGSWAFPGGFMNIDETLEECCKRELLEETGLKAGDLIEIGSFSSVDRDPRERVITVAYLTYSQKIDVKGGDDAERARWFNVKNLPPLAFDHEEIWKKALNVLKK